MVFSVPPVGWSPGLHGAPSLPLLLAALPPTGAPEHASPAVEAAAVVSVCHKHAHHTVQSSTTLSQTGSQACRQSMACLPEQLPVTGCTTTAPSLGKHAFLGFQPESELSLVLF